MAVLAVLALLPAASMAADAEDGEVTFSRDVAPVLFQHCVGCHRPGEVAPMSLLSYQEARPWAKSIRKMVQQRLMPPWGADPHIGSWANDMSLSDDQISTIVAWVEQGAAEGEAADLPEAPAFTEGWQLGEPDLVIELDPVEVWADGDDLFREQRVDVPLEETKWVRAMEFLPGDRRVTHHFLATYTTGTSAGGSGIFGVWTAGMQPYVFPAGMGRLIGPGTRIRMNSHYHPFGEDTVDRTRIGLYFGEGELQKEVSTLAVVNTGLRIPPGDPDYGVIGFHVFDNDARLIAFSPHLHVRGKAMKYELIEPDGERRTLLDVPRYNYNYQWLYYPTEPIAVPAGSKLEVTARWDNSAENASNPDPSAEIVYRGDTFNEMFVGFFEAYEDEGVFANPLPALRKLTQLLAEHPAADSFLVPGMLPLGLYLPRQEQGWAYTVSGSTMTTISLDDIRWQDASVEVHTTFPTIDADGIATLIEGKIDDEGKLVGKIHYGDEEAKAKGKQTLLLPFVSKPIEPSSATPTASSGL